MRRHYIMTLYILYFYQKYAYFFIVIYIIIEICSFGMNESLYKVVDQTFSRCVICFPSAFSPVELITAIGKLKIRDGFFPGSPALDDRQLHCPRERKV